MDYVASVYHKYLNSLVVACSGGARTYRPDEELDNTKHTSGCSLVATPGVLLVLFVLFTLKCLLCPSKRRQLYAGSEDAPELEEIVSCSPGKNARRVDSYATRAGRLTTGSSGSSSRSSNSRGSRGGGGSSSSRAPRPKGRSAHSAECEPVLSWRH